MERFGPYELRALLGRGGMGEVFRAVDTRKNRGEVALKRLPAGSADDPDVHRRFLREAELAARLRDPHVIPIHDYGDIDGRPYLEMRLVDGQDLASRLDEIGRLPPPRAAAIVAQIAGALDAAHHDGLVHRDVKPQNVLLSRSAGGADFVYLIDFGIAANLLSSSRSSSTISGTAAYMAPERFTATGDHRVDVYALGCVLHQLLTGSTPFSGDFMQLMYAHVSAAPPRPSALVAGLPASLDDVVATAMAKDPDRRHASAGALAEAALRAAGSAPGPAGPAAATLRSPGPPSTAQAPPGETTTVVDPAAAAGGPPGPPPRRRRRRLLAAAAVVVLVVAALVATLALQRRADPVRFPVGAGPSALAVTPDGRRAYVAASFGGTVSVVDLVDGGAARTLVVGTSPVSVARSPDGRRAFVVDRDSDDVSVIDTLTGTTTTAGPVTTQPADAAVTPDGRRTYVTGAGYGAVAGVTVLDNGVDPPVSVGDIPMSAPADGVAVSPDGRRVLVAVPGEKSLSVIDTRTQQTSSTIDLGVSPNQVAFASDGRRAYTSNRDTNTMSVVDTAAGTVVAVPVGRAPSDVAVTPDGRRALVTNTADGTLSVIDTASSTVVETLPAGRAPSAVAASPDGERAYVALRGENAVVALDIG